MNGKNSGKEFLFPLEYDSINEVDTDIFDTNDGSTSSNSSDRNNGHFTLMAADALNKPQNRQCFDYYEVRDIEIAIPV